MKKVILTGHSKGLGAGIAQNLLKQDVPILGISRSSNDTLKQEFPGLLSEVQLDLSDVSKLQGWMQSNVLQGFIQGCSQIILINNSGAVSPINPLGGQDAEAIALSVSLNVTAPLILSNAFVDLTQDIPDRRILHISSGAGRSAYASWSVYCATKAALDHHARCVAEDQIDGLRISSLAPGIVDTDMQGEIRSSDIKNFPQLEKFQAFKRDGDLATPDAVADKIVSLMFADSFGSIVTDDVRNY